MSFFFSVLEKSIWTNHASVQSLTGLSIIVWFALGLLTKYASFIIIIIFLNQVVAVPLIYIMQQHTNEMKIKKRKLSIYI